MPRWARILGGLCVAAGVGLCLLAAALGLRRIAWQASHDDLFRGSPSAIADEEPVAAPDPAAPAPPGRGQPMARLRIPRIGVDVVVAEGTDRSTLLRGPGHMEGSAAPGRPDNCIIAGHRDGPFRHLASIREGDLIEIEDLAGPSRYEVRSVDIVSGHDASLLAPSSRALLTLVTCYPIDFVGKAPERLVVRAEKVGQGLLKAAMSASRLQSPPPRAAMYRKMKQKRTAGSP